jgi:AraC-like DNA-binding protein
LSAPLLGLALDVAALVCTALLAIQLLTRGGGLTGARLAAAIALCNACHILLSHAEYGPWVPAAYRIDVGGWRPALNLARNLTPGLIMLLSHGLFAEDRRFPRWLLALFVVQVFFDEPIRWLLPGHVRPDWASAASAWLQSLFAGAAVYWALESWRADLVEARRRLRFATTLVVGLEILGGNLLLRLLIPPDAPANYAVHLGLVALDLAITAFILLRLDRLAAGVTPALATRPARLRANGLTEAQSAAALARLRALLEVEHIYREPGLSLKALADRAGLPEYRLRKLIHERLGYRNFNRLIHDYRIREACQQLGDPDLRRTPILTIALSVGYQSVNTFNRGFGEVMGTTPSAFRAAADTARAGAAFPEAE